MQIGRKDGSDEDGKFRAEAAMNPRAEAGRPCWKERKTIDGHQKNDRLRLSQAVTALGTTSEKMKRLGMPATAN